MSKLYDQAQEEELQDVVLQVLHAWILSEFGPLWWDRMILALAPIALQYATRLQQIMTTNQK